MHRHECLLTVGEVAALDTLAGKLLLATASIARVG
jgi:hypothetical protein